MKRSQLAWLVMLVMLSLAGAFGIPWAVIGLVVHGGLVANSAWLLAVLFLAAAVCALLYSWQALRDEERAENLREAGRL